MASYSDTTKLDRTWKNSQNKARGDNNTQVFEENIPTVVDVQATEIYADAIPSTPPASTLSPVKKWFATGGDGRITLTRDRKYNGARVWVAKGTHSTNYSSGSGSVTDILKNFISPKYGSGYVVKVFDGSNTQIPELDASSWLFDYKAGVLTFESDRTETGNSTSDSIKIDVYQYIGQFVSDKTADQYVKTDAADPSSGYLSAKVDGTTMDVNTSTHKLKVKDAGIGTTQIANNSVTAAKMNSGAAANGQALLADGAGGASYQTISNADEKTKISSADTTTGYLENKVIGTSGKVTITKNNTGANENLQINIGANVMDKAVDDSDDIAEGTTNKFATTTNLNAYLNTKSTSDLAEGSNLYHTNARVDARIESQAHTISGQYNYTTLPTAASDPTSANQLARKAYIDSQIAAVTAGLDPQEAVLSIGDNTPPVSPITGDRYIIGTSPTGAWSGHDGDITQYNGSGWDFTDYADNMVAFVIDVSEEWLNTGSSTWAFYKSTANYVEGDGIDITGSTISTKLNPSGDLEAVGGQLDVKDNFLRNDADTSTTHAITAQKFTSTVATGTAPVSVTSTTVNPNLNADLLDGQHGSYYQSRSNHTGTQTASTISDFSSTVSANTDVAANTAARHSAVTVSDTASIDLTLTGQQVSAAIKSDGVNDTHIDFGVSTNQVNSGDLPLGSPTTGDYSSGVNAFTTATMTADSIKSIDEILAELAPANAGTLEAQVLAIYNSTTQKYTGNLSAGNTNYKGGNGAGSSVAYIIKDGTFTLETPNTTTAINYGDQGVLRLYINGSQVDTFDLGSAFNESNRNGNQTYPPATSTNGFITIISVGKYNGFKKWQKVVSRLNFAGVDLRQGYNYFTLVHDLATDQTSATFDVFYDTDSGSDPSLGTPSLTIGTINSTKYLSGVRYVSLTDTLLLSVTGSYLFNNVYLASNPISYASLTGVSSGNISVTDGTVTGLSDPPAVGETMTVENKILTLTTASQVTNNARITCTPRDPYGTYAAVQSAVQNLLISTYADGVSGLSDDKNEHFSDEYYRLGTSFDFTSTSAAYTNQWTSSDALSNGNAQFYVNSTGSAHALVYPALNFSSGYLPTNTANYSSFSGNQVFQRAFISPSNKTGVTIQLNGVAAGIGQLGASDINVEIKLPSQTGWLDCAKPYDSGTGVASDGNGCLNGSISYTGGNAAMTLTFGGKTTGDSGSRIYIRVTLRNANRTITRISCTDW